MIFIFLFLTSLFMTFSRSTFPMPLQIIQYCSFLCLSNIPCGFPGGSDGKESTYNAGDLCSIPGLGRSPGKSSGNPLQYSCLENPHGQRSLLGYNLWVHQESDMTERLNTAQQYSMCGSFILLYSGHKHNIVKQLYSNKN